MLTAGSAQEAMARAHLTWWRTRTGHCFVCGTRIAACLLRLGSLTCHDHRRDVAQGHHA